MFTNPALSDFKTYFWRDFPYGTTPDTINDADVTSAIADAAAQINPALFGTQAAYTQAFLQLAAHYLVINILASSAGIAGKFAFLTASKSVGSVSSSAAIPQRILNNPLMAALATTNYGMKYLTFILPLLSGQIFSVQGYTKP